jgi:hypothetical protein
MRITRRTLLQTSLAASALGFESAHAALKPLKMLVLGGTGFIGPYQVD